MGRRVRGASLRKSHRVPGPVPVIPDRLVSATAQNRQRRIARKRGIDGGQTAEDECGAAGAGDQASMAA